MNWGVVIVIIVLLGIGYYLYSNPTAISNLASGKLPSISQLTQSAVSIPQIDANPVSYLNKTISVRAELEDLYGLNYTELYDLQNGVNDEMYQYFSSNQTQYYLPLVLPNQPNRVWQYGSSYLFTGHLSVLYYCGVGAYGYYAAINGTCHSSSADYWGNTPPSNSSEYYCTTQLNKTYGWTDYTCYPASPASATYYFIASNATLNG